MNLYQRWIVPPLPDLALRNKEATRFRAARSRSARCGSRGWCRLRSQYSFYGNQLERLVAVDPSEELLRMARRRARGVVFPIEFISVACWE